MLLSKSAKNALRAVIYLSSKSIDESMVTVDELSLHINAPKPFVSKLLQLLAKNEIISSKKGPNGGFFMTKENKKSKLSSVIIAIDGKKLYDDCVLGLKKCSDIKPCPLHDEYKCIKQDLIKMIDRCKIGDLDENFILEQTFLRV